jgi:hypothetical protein
VDVPKKWLVEVSLDGKDWELGRSLDICIWEIFGTLIE